MLGVAKGVELINQQTGGTQSPETIAQTLQAKMREKALKHATETLGTTKASLQKLLDKALSEGMSVQELGREITKQYGIEKGYRPLRIARTELTGSINDGSLKTLEEEGHSQKEWSTVTDGRERETHSQANGQVVGINDDFIVGGHFCNAPGDDRLPPEELVNCRCAILGAGSDEARKARLYQTFLRTHGALERRLVVSLRRNFDAQLARILSHFPTR